LCCNLTTNFANLKRWGHTIKWWTIISITKA
jgi:hypothetical protein